MKYFLALFNKIIEVYFNKEYVYVIFLICFGIESLAKIIVQSAYAGQLCNSVGEKF